MLAAAPDKRSVPAFLRQRSRAARAAGLAFHATGEKPNDTVSRERKQAQLNGFERGTLGRRHPGPVADHQIFALKRTVAYDLLLGRWI